MHEYDTALAVLNKLAIQDPGMDQPEQLLGRWFEQSGMNEEANEAYRRSIGEASVSQQASSRLAYARFLIYHNQPENAKVLLEPPNKEQAGDNPEALEGERLFLRALLARLESHNTEAQTILSKLHQNRPDSIAVSIHLAAVLSEFDDEAIRARALQIAESTVRHADMSAEAWATLGWVQLRLGDMVSAKASLGQSIKLGKPSRDKLHYLAHAKRISGKSDEANTLDRLYE